MKGMGMSKHRKSGHVHSNDHFTGIRKKNGTKRKQSLTRKQKLMKRRTHINKYKAA